MKNRVLPPFMALLLLVMLLLSIFSMLSCKKEEAKEPFYDEFLRSGQYVNKNRWGTSMSISKADSTLISLNIGSGNTIRQYFLRRYLGGVGYEWSDRTNVIRFKSIGNNTYEIVGDTLIGWTFERVY